MTHAPTDPPAETKLPADSVSPTSIALWLAIQLTAIVLIAARVQLWINGGDDSAALELMLVMQITGAALLLPAVMPNVRTTICIVLSSIPFLQIAGTIASIGGMRIFMGAIAVALWLIALRMALMLARSTLMRAIVQALAACLVLGSVILFYLRAEFAGASNTIDPAWFGPIPAALTLVRDGNPPDSIRWAWIQLASIALMMCVIVIARKVIGIARTRGG